MKINKKYLENIIQEETKKYISQLNEGMPRWMQIAALVAATIAGREYEKSKHNLKPDLASAVQSLHSPSTDNIQNQVTSAAGASDRQISAAISAKDKRPDPISVKKAAAKDSQSNHISAKKNNDAAKKITAKPTSKAIRTTTKTPYDIPKPVVSDLQSSIRSGLPGDPAPGVESPSRLPRFFNYSTTESIFDLVGTIQSSMPFTIKPNGTPQETNMQKETKLALEAVKAYLSGHKKSKDILDIDTDDEELLATLKLTKGEAEYKQKKVRTKLAEIFFEALRQRLATNQDDVQVKSVWRDVMKAADGSDVVFGKK